MPHCNRKSHLCILRKGIARPHYQFPHSCVFVSLSDLHNPRIGPHIFKQQNRQTDRGNIWMWKLGLRLRNYFSGNICFDFSRFVLCSAQKGYWGKWCSMAPSSLLHAVKPQSPHTPWNPNLVKAEKCPPYLLLSYSFSSLCCRCGGSNSQKSHSQEALLRSHLTKPWGQWWGLVGSRAESFSPSVDTLRKLN